MASLTNHEAIPFRSSPTLPKLTGYADEIATLRSQR